MKDKEILIELLLPNGEGRRFRVEPGSDWKSDLKTELKSRFPVSNEVEFVEEPKEQAVLSGRPFKSNVMFEVRKNYYVLGHVTAKIKDKKNR